MIDLVGPCWRWLAADGRRVLARLNAGYVYAAVVDWLVEWLEDCEGDEYGAVAGTLGRFGIRAKSHGVIDVQRTFPALAARGGPVVRQIGAWTAEQYGERLRSRLAELAGHESEPKVMPVVFQAWGIDG